jgi:predicted PurR-regulated permease PerM
MVDHAEPRRNGGLRRPGRAGETVSPRRRHVPARESRTPRRGAQNGGLARLLNRGTWWQIAVVLAVAFVLADGLFQVMWILARPLGLLLAAVVVALALAPVVDWLARRMPRIPAVLIVYFALLAIVGAIGWAVIPPLVEQASMLVANAPALVEQGQGILDRLDAAEISEDHIATATENLLATVGGYLVSLPMQIVSAALELTLIVGMSAYLIVTGPSLYGFILSLFPAHRRAEADSVMREMGQTMGGYVRGVVLDGLFVAVVVYIGLLVLGVPYPLVLAIIAFLGELIPVLGPFIAGVPAVGIALLDSIFLALLVFGFYFIVQQIESYIVLPHIMQRQAHIPPLLTMFALFAGGAVGGLFGALLAIPVSGALRVFVIRVVAPAIRRWTGAEDYVFDDEAPRPRRLPRLPSWRTVRDA